MEVAPVQAKSGKRAQAISGTKNKVYLARNVGLSEAVKPFVEASDCVMN